MSEQWKPGDRVYVIARPELTGTVVDGPSVQVQFDQPNTAAHGRMVQWYAPDELEWFTRPEGDSK